MSLNTVKYKGELLAEDERISTDTPGVLGEYKELRADALEADTLDITVLSESGTIRNFKKNDKVEYFRSGSRVGVYYLQSVTRVGPKLYTLSALSAVGLLIVRPHRGGIYTGQTVAEVVAEICGDIPVLIETVYRGIKLYGWLPIASARDSLVQVLFAIGAWLHTDENGTLRVQKLWDGTASIIGPGSVHAANIQVKYLDPVSAVAVTEHQYIAGTEDVTLFEGTAQQGDVIEFDEPAHTLTAEGFTVLESGANYAVLSAGTGKLTGKSYVHNRRVVTRTVTEGAAENVEEITDATLVSLVNSSAVAQRMAAYYACREQLTVDVNPAAEHAGHVVSLWNEWDKQQTLACIASRETTISGLLKSRTSAILRRARHPHRLGRVDRTRGYYRDPRRPHRRRAGRRERQPRQPKHGVQGDQPDERGHGLDHDLQRLVPDDRRRGRQQGSRRRRREGADRFAGRHRGREDHLCRRARRQRRRILRRRADKRQRRNGYGVRFALLRDRLDGVLLAEVLQVKEGSNLRPCDVPSCGFVTAL